MKRNYIVYLTGTVLLMTALLTGCRKKSGEDSLSASLEQSAADLMSLSGSKESETEGKTENSFPVIPSKSEEESSDEVLETEKETLPYTVLETIDSHDLWEGMCVSDTVQIAGMENGTIKIKQVEMVPPLEENTTMLYEVREWGYAEENYQLENDCEVWIWNGTFYNKIDRKDLTSYLNHQTDNSIVWDMYYIYGGEKVIVTKLIQKCMPFSKLFCSDFWDMDLPAGEEPAASAQTETILEIKTSKAMKYEIQARVLKAEDSKLLLQEVVMAAPKPGEEAPNGYTFEEWDMFTIPLAENCEIWYIDESFCNHEKIASEEFPMLLDYWNKNNQDWSRLWNVFIENGEIVRIIEQYIA